MTLHRPQPGNDTALPSDDTALAGGTTGPDALRRLTAVVLDALHNGARTRGGPLPAGGPAAVTARTRARRAPVLPDHGIGATAALHSLVTTAAEGAADPADPRCAAHLHCPPLALAAAADLAASALNPSLDSWDQAPAAAVIEQDTAAALAALVYPDRPAPDALITSGGTESNLIALLLAREHAAAHRTGTLHIVCGGNAHHSIHRAAWILGLPAPRTVPARAGRLHPDDLDHALRTLPPGPDGTTPSVLVVATAGTTDEGLIDPLPELARVTAFHGARLHIDAAYGGPLLFSDRLRHRLDGLQAAATVTFDLHKLGWQPVAAGVLATTETTALHPLAHQADYLNAEDDTEAGLPDLLGRSLRTSRRPDTLKIAATLSALGRHGLARMVEHCVTTAEQLAARIDAHPALRRRPGPLGISTVLFRPTAADTLPDDRADALIAAVRRELLTTGQAVLGRATAADTDGRPRLWLKATLLHPGAAAADLEELLHAVTTAVPAAVRRHPGQPAPPATTPTASHPPQTTRGAR